MLGSSLRGVKPLPHDLNCVEQRNSPAMQATRLLPGADKEPDCCHSGGTADGDGLHSVNGNSPDGQHRHVHMPRDSVQAFRSEKGLALKLGL